MHDTDLTPPSSTKRAATLILLITAYIACGAWFFYKEQRAGLVQNTELALWADARATVNLITIWHAPLRQQGRVFAASDVVRLYTGNTLPLGHETPDQFQQRKATQRSAMNVYLRRFADRTEAAQAALVNVRGELLADSRAENLEQAEEAAYFAFDAAALAARLGQGEPFELPARMSPTGPLLDIVFPVYALSMPETQSDLRGGVVLTFSLASLLDTWLPHGGDSPVNTVLLEQDGDRFFSLSGGGLTEQTWRHGTILPGEVLGAPLPYRMGANQSARANKTGASLRLTQYPAADGRETPQNMLAAAIQVPLMDGWFVVKETPALALQGQLAALRLRTAGGALIAGGLLFGLLFLRWWWLDGRLYRRMTGSVTSISDSLYKSKQLLTSIAAASSDGICVIGPDGRVAYANPVFAAHCRLVSDALAGKPLRELISSDRYLLHNELDAKVFGTGKEQTCFDTWIDENAAATRYEVRKQPLTSADGKIWGVLSVFRRIPDVCVDSLV